MKKFFVFLLLVIAVTSSQAQVTVNLVKDINVSDQDVPRSAESSQTYAVKVLFKGHYYFSGFDAAHSAELWRTDGTAAGTVLFKDINLTTGGWSEGGSFPEQLTVVNDRLYFFAFDGVSYNLWSTDGSQDGTYKTNVPSDNFLYSVNNRLIVYGTGGLWLTDGTANGGEKFPEEFIYPGAILFTASSDSTFALMTLATAEHGLELWRTDGTIAGTYMVKEIQSGPTGSISTWVPIVEWKGIFYFSGGTEATSAEPWRTDGTAEGTYMIKEIYPGMYNSMGDVSQFQVLSDHIYFTARDPQESWSMYRTDGTAEGTEFVFSPVPGNQAFGGTIGYREANDKIIYINVISTDQGGVSQTEVWAMDKITGEHERLFYGNNAGHWNTYGLPGWVLTIQQPVGTSGPQFWLTDGTAANTFSPLTVDPNDPYNIRNIKIINNALYFIAAINGKAQLWKISGRCALQVTDFDGEVNDYNLLNDKMLLSATNATYGGELFYYSMAEEGCVLATEEEEKPQPAMRIYPNPTAAQIIFDPALESRVQTVTATTVTGKVYSLTVKDNSCDISSLPEGLYIVRIPGKPSESLKLVKRGQ